MAEGDDSRNVRDVVREIAQDLGGLIREEMALARTELRQGMRQLARGLAFLVVSAFILNAGFLALVAFLVLGLSEAMAAWLAALLVGVVLAVIGAVLVRRGIQDMRNADLKPERTIESLKEDAKIVKERGHE